MILNRNEFEIEILLDSPPSRAILYPGRQNEDHPPPREGWSESIPSSNQMSLSTKFIQGWYLTNIFNNFTPILFQTGRDNIL